MPNRSLVQLPPDSTGKQVGTWTDGDGKHYHGFVLVDAEGNPINVRYMVNLLEFILVELQNMNAAREETT